MIECCNEGRYLGYFHNLPEVLAKYPTGRRGWFFTNGETLSVWMWDELSRGWHDTNCVDDTLQGVVDDAAGFEPVVKPGVKTSYLYVQPEAGTVTFRNFVNGESPVSVATEGTAVILLFWNGDLWEVAVTPFYVDLSRYAWNDLGNVSDEKVKEMAGIMKVAHEELPGGEYDSVIVLGTDDAADRGASIGITSRGVPFVTTHHFPDTPIEGRKPLALADLSNVESGTITPDMTAFADLMNSLHYAEYDDIDDIKEKGCYVVRYYKRISGPSVRTTYNYYYLIVDVQDINVSQTLIGFETFKSRSCKAGNPWSEWETGMVNLQPAILPREFLSLTSSSTSEEILTILDRVGGAEAIAALFQERKGSVFLDNDENGLHTLTDYRKVAENPWELYFSYFEYNVLVEIFLYDDGTGAWHCEKNEYEIPQKQ